MREKMIVFFWLLLPQIFAYAQLAEDFSDEDFKKNHGWIFDTSDFKVNNSFQLQSNNTVGNSSFYVSTASVLATSAQWEFLAAN
ncbi:MAG TPA: hypothetical protein VN722_06360 [Hanamia sp.]|nr:hypothetical protein [Hanamia sp.]